MLVFKHIYHAQQSDNDYQLDKCIFYPVCLSLLNTNLFTKLQTPIKNTE